MKRPYGRLMEQQRVHRHLDDDLCCERSLSMVWRRDTPELSARIVEATATQ